VDVALRRREGEIQVHFVNRSSGIPNQPNNGAIDEIPAVGPMRIRVKMDQKPRSVRVALEKAGLKHRFSGGWLTVEVDRVRIHDVVRITE